MRRKRCCAQAKVRSELSRGRVASRRAGESGTSVQPRPRSRPRHGRAAERDPGKGRRRDRQEWLRLGRHQGTAEALRRQRELGWEWQIAKVHRSRFREIQARRNPTANLKTYYPRANLANFAFGVSA